jgi:N6-adenosine-specific RNA methylase IME4
VSATSLARVICNLARSLAETLRDGTALISDARTTEHNIREAEGWLLTARRYLDPADPLSQEERTDQRLSADTVRVWDGLTPPYSTIVVDPPWAYKEGWPGASTSPNSNMNRGVVPEAAKRRKPLPYSSMTVQEIAALPVAELAAADACLFLWTTNRYIREGFRVAVAWGFRPSQVLTWCKAPRGIGPGGTFATTTEFVIYARRGNPATTRTDSTWWHWPRANNGAHSSKPAAFFDLVEAVGPGPYVELFCRRPRLGWDSWGYGYEVAS